MLNSLQTKIRSKKISWTSAVFGKNWLGKKNLNTMKFFICVYIYILIHTQTPHKLQLLKIHENPNTKVHINIALICKSDHYFCPVSRLKKNWWIAFSGMLPKPKDINNVIISMEIVCLALNQISILTHQSMYIYKKRR